MNDNLELKLQAWIDGEVSPSEARRLAQLVQRDPQASQLVLELRMTRQLLAANQPQAVVPETREFFWSKIERQIQSQARNPAPTGWRGLHGWRRLMGSLAGLATLAAIVLLAVRQFSPTATFDEVSTTADGMEAMTFHDQTAGMTVVWLQDSQDSQSTQPADAAPDDGDSDLQM
jgi:anti-sigma factor RsiW